MTGDRGQTNLDFLVGVGVFLATAAVVAAFATGLLSPFVADQAGPAVADRAADELTRATLAGDGASTLDVDCTRAFFGGPAATCPFTAGESLADRLGVEDHAINVTVESVGAAADRAVVCADGSGTAACDAGGTRLAAGPAPPASETVVAATRLVALGGDPVVVVVRTW